ncbi:hypothetical protein [Streptomyces sp. NPDC055085]
MATSYNLLPSGDYRNENWVAGGSATTLYGTWSATNDANYWKSPASKGRAAVSYPQDVSAGNVPSGAAITSVTVWVRANKTSSASNTLTVNMVAADDTSQFVSRTLSDLSTSIQTLEVGTYKADPLGRAWTRHTLNQMLLQVFSYTAALDGVRVYRLYAQINYHAAPTASVVYPTGTQYTPTPTLIWNYQQGDGDIQQSAEYKVFTAVQLQQASFNPDVTIPVYSGTVSGDRTTITLPTGLVPDSYYVAVRVTSTLGATSAWAGRSFAVQGAFPGAPAPSFAGVGTGGPGGFVAVVPSNDRCSSFLTLRDGSNLLSVQQADFETITDSLGYTTSNCTVAQDTSAFFGTGNGSMKLTASSAATMSVQSSYLEVAPNTPITAVAQFLAGSTGRTVNTRITFFDASYASAGGTITGVGVDSASTWTQASCTGTTPAGAVYAQLVLLVSGPANGEVHNVDGAGLMYGANTPWSHGGHMSRNLLSSFASDADDPASAVAPWTAKAATTYSVVSTSGTGAEGAKAFKMLYAGLSPTISRVSTGTVFTSTSTSSSYTLNKPSSVADGDVLVAYIATDAGTVVPPAGWTLVNGVDSGGSWAATLTVLMRDGLAADPSTWTGTIPPVPFQVHRTRSVVVAYRGAAPVASQLMAQAIVSSIGGALTITTPGVNNATSNAWRLSAFSWRDDVAGGTSVANIVAPTLAPIQYVGKATSFMTHLANSAFTLNKPAGLASGDLMVAAVEANANVTLTAPAGWTQVRRLFYQQSNGSAPMTLTIYKRTAGGSEPQSWSSTYTGGSASTHLITSVVAYRYAADASLQFIDENGSVYPDDPTVSVTNTDSKAWRISVVGSNNPDTFTLSTNNGDAERVDETTRSTYSGDPSYVGLHIYDSNKQISTGSTTFPFFSVGAAYDWASWIGIIKPASSAPAAGGNESELADGVTGTADGFRYLNLTVNDSGAVAATGVNQSVTGIFTPGSGTAVDGTVGWIGYLVPAAGQTFGQAGVQLTDYIDISKVSDDVLDRAGGKVTAQAAFLGSTAGTPIISVDFYVGNELIVSKTAQGSSFNTSTWVKSVATFDMPETTTRLKMSLYINDRAVNDYALYDKASLAFGDSTVWRRGTGRSAHPIMNVPVIEYREDRGNGYSDWAALPASQSALLTYDQLTGLCMFEDQSVTPLAPRMYRARTVSYGLAGDTFVSDYGANSDEITVQATTWWLKDPYDSSNSMALSVYLASSLASSVTNTGVPFLPLGADRPIVLTQGFKGGVIPITVEVDHDDFAKLQGLLRLNKTLILQSSVDDSWWVRPVGDMKPSLKPTQAMFKGNPLRFVDLTFYEVDPLP